MEDNNEIPQNPFRSLDQYLECQDYSGEDGFFKFEQNNKYYFALNFNGKTFLRSQSYSTEIARNNGINSIHRNALLDERWINSKTSDSKFYYSLIAGNKQEIARSCYYNSEEEMQNDLNWVRGENSIIGIGATEIDGVWYSAVSLLEMNKVENNIENKIENLEISKNLKTEKEEIQNEIILDKIENPNAKIAGEITPAVIEKKGGCGKLWIWILLAALLITLCIIFCRECGGSTKISDSRILKKQNVEKINSERKIDNSVEEISTSKEIEKENFAEYNNSETNLIMQNALITQTSFSINEINNDFEKNNFSEISKSKLDEISEFLKNHNEINIEIHGHTDDSKSDQLSKNISLQKAEMIKKYLVEKGISEIKLRAIGFGERFPIASNLTEEGKVKNRRIEFKFVE
ncbi:MAG: OmpA family protein [Ignavibacteriae bacterium]|nr:OmpA family protein [Ignavibacteriota bacterium]